MNYIDEIKSGISVAGFDIGENINSYLPNLYLQEVEVDRVIFNKGNYNEIHHYIIDKNIKINTSKEGEILNISCSNIYYGKYKDILYLGITIEDIISKTDKQVIMFDSLFVNQDYGFCFVLPYPYKEVDYISHLPKDLVLKEFTIGRFEKWFR
ncbi:hypothetical protein [Capnocytophaga bilenii]